MHFAIIGQGLAGSSLAIHAHKHGHKITCFDLEKKNSASRVSTGIVNPLVLKNRTALFKSKILLDHCKDYYYSVEKLLGKPFLINNPIHEILKTDHEIDNWKILSKKINIKEYIGSIENIHHQIDGKGFGIVQNSLRLDVKKYLTCVRDWLHETQSIFNEKVENVSILKNKIHVNNQLFDGLLLAEGLDAKWTQKNFGELQFAPTKGEGIVIQVNSIDVNFPIHRNVFMIQEDKNIYTVASTFDRNDLSVSPSINGRTTLLKHLKSWFKDDFKVLDHWAAIRPTMTDRKICYGWHRDNPNVGYLNGLGSRGVLTSPYYSSLLWGQHKSS